MRKNLVLNVLIAVLLFAFFGVCYRILYYQQDKIERLYRHIEFRDERIKELKQELDGKASEGISEHQFKVL